MNIRVLAVAAAAFLLAAPSFAAPSFAATTYFVAHPPKSKTCAVVTAKPAGKTQIMVGTAGYATAARATLAMKSAVECK